MAKDKEYMKKYKEEYKNKASPVTVILPNAVREEFEKLAELDNTKLSTYIRNCAFAFIHQQAKPTKDIKQIMEDMRQLVFLVRNIANNINQVAHRSNTMKMLTQEDEHSILMELKRLEDAVKDYTKDKVGQ